MKLLLALTYLITIPSLLLLAGILVIVGIVLMFIGLGWELLKAWYEVSHRVPYDYD